MKYTETGKIRNVVFLGQGGAGKTSLAEAMLFLSKGTDRLGKIADGNTISDFDSEEIKRKSSISLSILPVEWNGDKINIIDTPGYFDFEGEMVQGIRAAEAAIIVVSGKSGIGVGTDKAFKLTKRINMPRAFFINKLDDEKSDFFKVFASLKEKYGNNVIALEIPIINDGKLEGVLNVIDMKARITDANGNRKEVPIPHGLESIADSYRISLNEAIAETSDELMEKFFSGEAFTTEDTLKGLSSGILSGSIYPVMCGSSVSLCGTGAALDSIAEFFPSPDKAEAENATDKNNNETVLKANENESFAGFVFKTVADPFVGKMSYIKVVSGFLKQDSQVINFRTNNSERIGKIYFLKGKKQIETEKAAAGDIVVVTKLTDTNTGDSLCDSSKVVDFRKIAYPKPCLSMAVLPKEKGDEEKISSGFHKLREEDLTFTLENNTETHQQVISGLGEMHIDVLVSKLKNKFGTSVTLTETKVPYRETIKKKVKVEGKHKKQSGGHGQYGHVWIEFEPNYETEDLIFEEKIFGGAVPRNFFPAVEKGLRDCILKGVLAGYPVVNLKATLVDGSYHDVDSSEMAFKIAASVAYKEGMIKANPIILEPIGNLKVCITDANMGDIIGDINKRRGRVLGMIPFEDGLQIVEAEVPMAEMTRYAIDLRSMSQGVGSFVLKFEKYEEAPPLISQKVIEDSKKE